MPYMSEIFSVFIGGFGQGKHAEDVIPLPFFIGDWRTRVNRNCLYQVVTEAAERVGLHNPCSDQMEDHFKLLLLRALVYNLPKALRHVSRVHQGA